MSTYILKIFLLKDDHDFSLKGYMQPGVKSNKRLFNYFKNQSVSTTLWKKNVLALFNLSRNKCDYDSGSWEQNVERCPEYLKNGNRKSKGQSPFNIQPNIFSKTNFVLRNYLPTFNMR